MKHCYPVGMAIVLLLELSGSEIFAQPVQPNPPVVITQRDYREFCGSAEHRWNLATGYVKSSITRCAPHMYDPPEKKVRKINRANLMKLRTLARRALSEGVTDKACLVANPGSFVQIGSGVTSISISQGDKAISSPIPARCLSETGKELVQLLKLILK